MKKKFMFDYFLSAKIGGWLGIINGASIISLAELFILFSIFVFRLTTGRAQLK